MKDKETIEKMAKMMQKHYEKNDLLNFKWFAESAYKCLTEDSVVLSREEYEKLNVKYILALEQLENKGKETAEKILAKAEKKAYFKDGGYYDKDRYYLDMEDLKEIIRSCGVEIKE